MSTLTGTVPYVSVIIPVYNDPDGLKTTLRSLMEQSYPNDAHEVIVVDNNSTDTTRHVADRFAEKQSNISVLVEDDIQSSYAARNRGIKHADGEILAFIDADMYIEKDWLESAIEAMEQREAAYMACDVELTVSADQETLAAMYNRRTGFPIERYIKREHFAPTCCLFVRQWVFEEYGTFDTRLISGGDVEFGNRIYDEGIELEYESTVTAYHPVRSSIRELLKKSFRVGKGSGQLAQYYPDRYGDLGTINPATLLGRMLFESDSDEEGTQSAENTPSSLIERVGFPLISFLENIWYVSGRASTVLK